jgi:elongation factor Ts
MTIDAKMVKDLREKTGAPMMDCKEALTESNGDLEKAAEYLRKKGLKTADKKASRETSEGLVGSYIHHNGLVGVLVEVNCETDFVARNEEFQALVHDLGQHIAAAKPLYLDREEVPADVLAKEREIIAAQIKGKPDNIVEKIVDGKINKYFQENCLLEQPFVKDDSKTILDLVKELIGKLGENMKIRRFARFDVKG